MCASVIRTVHILMSMGVFYVTLTHGLFNLHATLTLMSLPTCTSTITFHLDFHILATTPTVVLLSYVVAIIYYYIHHYVHWNDLLHPQIGHVHMCTCAHTKMPLLSKPNHTRKVQDHTILTECGYLKLMQQGCTSCKQTPTYLCISIWTHRDARGPNRTHRI